MKKVILGDEYNASIYFVPDEIADNLEKYCCDFCDKWIYLGPEAQKFKASDGVCYSYKDFISYLNNYVCEREKAFEVEKIGNYNIKKSPKEYTYYPCFFF